MIDLRVVKEILCACGCGGVIRSSDRRGSDIERLVRESFYLHGHNGKANRGKPRPEIAKPRFCACGCGGLVARTSSEAGRRRFLIGHVRISEGHKAAVSKAQSGRVKPWMWQGSDRVRRMQGIKLAVNSGPNNSNWKGGTSAEIKRLRMSSEYRAWRLAVFTRDDWTCQDCGTRGGSLHPHHVIPVSIARDKMFDVGNGRTLCVECHRRLHETFKPWLSQRVLA